METLVTKEKPIFECLAIGVQSNGMCNKSQNKMNFVPSGIMEDTSLTNNNSGHPFFSTRKTLNESVTNPSTKTFLNSKLMELDNVYNDLKFNNTSVILSAFKILNICAKNKNFNVSVSKSSDNEILIYSKKNNQYRNLLFDNDGDIQFILIGNKLGEEKSAVFSQEDKLDYSQIASLI